MKREIREEADGSMTMSVNFKLEGSMRWFKKSGHLFKIVFSFHQHTVSFINIFFRKSPQKEGAFLKKIIQAIWDYFSKILAHSLQDLDSQLKNAVVWYCSSLRCTQKYDNKHHLIP